MVAPPRSTSTLRDMKNPTQTEPTTHFVAMLDGVKYAVVGLGRTAEEAKAAAVAEYQRTNNAGYGFETRFGERIWTLEQVEAYYGFRVYGPLADGQALTE